MKPFRHRWIRIPFWIGFTAFACIGFFLSASYLAIKLKWTVEGGTVDANNRYFADIQDKYNQGFRLSDSASVARQTYEELDRILVLNRFYPKNAQVILDLWKSEGNVEEVRRMLDAADLELMNDSRYQQALAELKKPRISADTIRPYSVFRWMNIAEWQDFKIAVAKDKKLIDSVAKQTGVEARTIVACLVGEQIRLFNSDREAYKRWISPLKILSVESTFSYGVTGIKELTAQTIEAYAKDSTSVFYTGKQDEHLLDFKTSDVQTERFKRLTDFRNHYYSYLYAALFLKQVKTQWEKAGFPINDRPEILATLFNVGFPNSKPKAYPQVGGAEIKVHEIPYTFGAIAYQFYYSGDLVDLFPNEQVKFRNTQL